MSRPVEPAQDEDWADLMRYRAGMPAERPPVGQLPPQDWLQWPETQAVIAALQANGQQVRFVGGCVRDALCHRPIYDIDISTPNTPETVIALLESAGIRAVATGLEHGTISAIVPPHRFEITTLRTDQVCDGRHAEVQWTSNWMADAARRDFSINALSARPDGAVYDYFDGLTHLAHGRVVFIGRPTERLREDYLRILRYFRFYARYGQGNPSRAALAACRAEAPHLAELSGERIRDEMLKILACSSAAEVVALMIGEKILGPILPEAVDVGRLRQLIFLETRGIKSEGVCADPLRRLAALLPSGQDAAPVVAEIAKRFRFSRADQTRLVAISQLQELPSLEASECEIWKDLYHSGGAVCLDRLLLSWAGWRSVEGRVCSQRTQRYLNRLEQAVAWQPVAFPVHGRDLLALGIPAGPAMGDLLKRLEQWWVDRCGTPSPREVVQQAHLWV